MWRLVYKTAMLLYEASQVDSTGDLLLRPRRTTERMICDRHAHTGNFCSKVAQVLSISKLGYINSLERVPVLLAHYHRKILSQNTLELLLEHRF